MKAIVLMLSAMSVSLGLSACSANLANAPAIVSGQSVSSNFKLADAIRIYSCAVERETDASRKARLQEGLRIHQAFSKNEEFWTSEINKDRNMQYRILNDIAVRYQCF